MSAESKIRKPETPAIGSSAELRKRLATMRALRKTSTGHYSVRVDELRELIGVLEAILDLLEVKR